MPGARGRINRFVVMAMLQAARARTLGLPEDAAYSWGLNRAIFYAAAKRGFRRGSGTGETGATPAAKGTSGRSLYQLGDEEAYRDTESKALRFTIGDEDQTPEDFEQKIASRFGSKENFRTAWDEAMRVVGEYDRAALGSRRQFFDEIYKPRRDALSAAWAQRYGAPQPGA